MLAQPADDIADALARLGTAALEWKVDGARVQVHKAGDEVQVYTRSLNDVTASVPEIVEALRALPARELILDGEAIALAADGAPHAVPGDDAPLRPQARRRAHARRAAARGATSSIACYRDGASLVDRPAHERFDALAARAAGSRS